MKKLDLTPEKEIVLDYLMTHDHITIGDAYRILGIMNVQTIIRALIGDGHPITHEWARDKTGRTTYIQYRLMTPEEIQDGEDINLEDYGIEP